MKREVIILIAAVLMGLAGLILYNLHVETLEAELASEYTDKVEVVALARPLTARERLAEDAIQKREVPRKFFREDTVKWDERADVLGQALAHPIDADQILLWSDLLEKSRRSVDDSIPPGRAVVTLPVDVIGGVSGLISPGSRVDVIGIFRRLDFSDSQEKVEEKMKHQVQSLEELNAMMSRFEALTSGLDSQQRAAFYVVPVARNLGVFAVGSRARTGSGGGGDGRDGYSTLSFAVPPKTQVLLTMAMHKVDTEGGRLLCVLRSSQAASQELDQPGEVFRSSEFLDLIPEAHADLQESR